MLIFQYIWQYHSKSYDNDTVYSSENGAAICTMVQRLSSPGRDSAAGPVPCPPLLRARVPLKRSATPRSVVEINENGGMISVEKSLPS